MAAYLLLLCPVCEYDSNQEAEDLSSIWYILEMYQGGPGIDSNMAHQPLDPVTPALIVRVGD